MLVSILSGAGAFLILVCLIIVHVSFVGTSLGSGFWSFVLIRFQRFCLSICVNNGAVGLEENWVSKCWADAFASCCSYVWVA